MLSIQEELLRLVKNGIGRASFLLTDVRCQWMPWTSWYPRGSRWECGTKLGHMMPNRLEVAICPEAMVILGRVQHHDQVLKCICQALVQRDDHQLKEAHLRHNKNLKTVAPSIGHAC